MINTRSKSFLNKRNKIVNTISALIDDINDENEIPYKKDIIIILFYFLIKNSYYVKNCGAFKSHNFYRTVKKKISYLLNDSLIKKDKHFKNFLSYFRYKFYD